MIQTGFPAEPLDIRVQALIFGEWVDFGPMKHVVDDFFTDVFTDVFIGRITTVINRLPDQEIQIDHGRADETSIVDPSSVSLILWNEDGWLTPDDPRSPYWSENSGGWGLNTELRILVDGEILFWGELSEIHPVWPHGDLADTLTDEELHDLAVVDVIRLGYAHVEITASGILRRLAQRTKPLRSPLTRLAQYNATFPGRIAGYWPFEDGSEATVVASGLEGDRRTGKIVGFSLASDDTLPGSDPLPKLSKGSDGTWAVSATSPSLNGHWCVDLFGSFSEAPTKVEGTTRILEIHSTGTILTWTVDLLYSDYWKTDLIWVRGLDADGSPTISQSAVPDFYGQMMQLQFTVDGAGWSFLWSPLGSDSSFGLEGSGVGTVGQPYWAGGSFIDSACDVVVGHVMFRTSASAMPAGWAIPADQGWIGERAMSRMSRLARETGTPIALESGTGFGTKLGVQRSGSLLGLLQEAADADGGILFEDRTQLRLRYMPRRNRYNRAVLWTINAKTDGFQNPFEPVRDDQQIINDITVERIGGAKYQRTDPASIAKVGVYDASVSISLDTDRKGRLKNQAGWRLHLGTHEGTRYPQVTVQFDSAQDPAAQIAVWKTMLLGRKIRVTNLPPQHPIWPDYIDLMVEGWSETLSPYGWTTTINCSPAAPWTVARYGISRYWPRNSRLSSAVDADETFLPVVTDGADWTTDPSSYPFDVLVGGSELVQAIAGSVGTLQVVRNQNGLGRAHPAGASVVPYDTAIAPL